MAQDSPSPPPTQTIGSRIRSTSISLTDAALKFNPQPGMWAATGTAIAYAPTINELREPIAGGSNIEFDVYGRSARTVVEDGNGELGLVRSQTLNGTQLRRGSNAVVLDGNANGNANGVGKEDGKGKYIGGVLVEGDGNSDGNGGGGGIGERKYSLADMTQVHPSEKHGWVKAVKHGLVAFSKFVLTPTGFLMTIYGLNIVAWGAMLFFLLLDAAPAMDHPNKDSNDSPRKKWLEIDSQILNALFCVTGFGLAPWRFRDLYWLELVRFKKNKKAMKRLAEQNKTWFRPGNWYTEGLEKENEEMGEKEKEIPTFTGERAPPTRLWKLSFVVWMMVLNTLLQGVLSGFMWGYNRINRPSWATGTFIALGCGVSLAAGVMMWWEGRKVKKIEGPVIKVVESAVKDGEEERGGSK